MSVNVETTTTTTTTTTFPAPTTTHPEEQEQQPDVLIEADKALDEFKRLVETEYYPKALSLREQAKILFTQVKEHWTEGKHKVLHEHGKWSAEDFDSDMIKLLKQQEASWDKLEELVKIEREELKNTYQKVVQAKTAVDNARGKVNHIPVVDMFVDLSTPEQHTICTVYQKKLHETFHDAAKEYQALVGYPDGLLTQVHVMRKHAMEETARLVEWLTKKDRHHQHHGKQDEEKGQHVAAAGTPPHGEEEQQEHATARGKIVKWLKDRRRHRRHYEHPKASGPVHEKEQEHVAASPAVEDMPKVVTE